MVAVGLFARLKAKKGKEEALKKFLADALVMANQETQTQFWFALQFGLDDFAIFDAFPDEAGRQTHLQGRIAAALGANAAELLAGPPQMDHVDVFAVKSPS